MTVSPKEYLKVTKVTPGYWQATFNDPPINLWGPEMSLAVWQLLDDLEKDEDVRVVVFDSSAPEFFVAHLDVAKGVETMIPPGRRWSNLIQRLTQSSVISIAAIRGRCRGLGSEFSVSCDIRFASREKAILCQPEVGAGLVPGGASAEWLPRIVGRSRALEIFIGSEDFDATTAELYGYVNRAIPDAEFEAFVDKFARRVGGYSKFALAQTKSIVNMRTGLPSGAEYEHSWEAFVESSKKPDAQNRVANLFASGLQQDSDCERELGHYLGLLTSEENAPILNPKTETDAPISSYTTEVDGNKEVSTAV